jgi:hypothetical protein
VAINPASQSLDSDRAHTAHPLAMAWNRVRTPRVPTWPGLARRLATRAELNGLDDNLRYDNALFSSLKKNSNALQAELVRFIFARRGEWSSRFFEYLLF